MENILLIFAGGLLSVLNRYLTLKMIAKRNDKPTIYRFTNTKLSNVIWAALDIKAFIFAGVRGRAARECFVAF